MKRLVIKRKDLKNNLKIVRKIINSEGRDDRGDHPKIIAVVKGNGMGLDLVQYAKFLNGQGIDFFAVADSNEAFSLREAGIDDEILLMTPPISEKEIRKLMEQRITITISSIEQIRLVEKIANEEKKEIKGHIKIDTGFGRYGFLYYDKEIICQAFSECKKIKITGMYTHFSKPMDEKNTTKQFERFLEVVQFLKKDGQDPGMLHCAASTATIKYPMMHLNAVRIGSLIQGRTLIKIENLIKIGEFKSNIQEIKTVPKGYNISYGGMYRKKKETKIGIIPVGYMDGLNMRKDRDIFSLKENF